MQALQVQVRQVLKNEMSICAKASLAGLGNYRKYLLKFASLASLIS
jgi:hypothetical protein